MSEQVEKWRAALAQHPVESCGRLDMATSMPEPVKVGRVESDVVRYVYFKDGSECIVVGKLADHVAFRAADYEALRQRTADMARALSVLRREYERADCGSIPDYSGPSREPIPALTKSWVLRDLNKLIATLTSSPSNQPPKP